jgi:hypothetical protein
MKDNIATLRAEYLDAVSAYAKAFRRVRRAVAALKHPLSDRQADLCAEKMKDEDRAGAVYRQARNVFLRALKVKRFKRS